MATKFQIKRSTVSGVVPTTFDIAPGELAVNLADKRLYSANTTSTFEIGVNPYDITVSNYLTLQKGIIANGTSGSAGQVLTTNGTSAYWSTLSAGGFTNGQSISVNNFVVTGAFSANNANGVAGQILFSNGTGVYWADPTAAASEVVMQQFTANGTSNSFTIAGGYIPNAIEVYLNGVKQLSNSEVVVTSGSTVNFISTPGNNYIVDVFGYRSTGNIVSDYLLRSGGIVTGNITFNSNALIIANGTFGTTGQVLTSNGSVMYWSSAGFSNGQSITVNDLVVNAGIYANGTLGTSGQVLTTNGSSVFWAESTTSTIDYGLVDGAVTTTNDYGSVA